MIAIASFTAAQMGLVGGAKIAWLTSPGNKRASRCASAAEQSPFVKIQGEAKQVHCPSASWNSIVNARACMIGRESQCVERTVFAR
jgi:hypothetical protein